VSSDLVAGVIGCGHMGSNHVRVYSEMRGIDFVLVYDPDTFAANRMKTLHGAYICDDVQCVLDDSDLVSICTPTTSHMSVACSAADANVPVLVEKPIAHSLDSARAMASLSFPVGSGVGHIERFNPVVAHFVKHFVAPYYVSIRRHNPASRRVTGGSVVDDLMIHDVDLVQHVLFGRQHSNMRSLSTEDYAHVLLDYSDHTIVSMSASRVGACKVREIVAECVEHTLVADLVTQELHVFHPPGAYMSLGGDYHQENLVERVAVPRVEPLKVELATFADCVRNHTSFPVSFDDAVSNIEMCEAIKNDTSHCNCGRDCGSHQ